MEPPPVTSSLVYSNTLEITSPRIVPAARKRNAASEGVKSVAFEFIYNVSTLLGCIGAVVAIGVVIGVMYSKNKWGVYAYVSGAVIYAFAAIFSLQQFLSRLARMPRSFGRLGLGRRGGGGAAAAAAVSSSTSLAASPGRGGDPMDDSSSSFSSGEEAAPKGEHCCGSLTAVPALLFVAFTTRVVWFVLKAMEGKGTCKDGDALLKPSKESDYFRRDICVVENFPNAPKNPCCEAYVNSNPGLGDAHSGLTTIFSRLGNMLLFTGFSLIGFYFARVSGAAVKSQQGGDAAIYQADQSAGSDNKSCIVRLFSYGSTISKTLVTIANFWLWLFEIAMLGMRLYANSPIPRSSEYLCVLAEAGFVENIMVAAMFGILGIALFLLGLQVVQLSVLKGLDLKVVGKIKCKVRMVMSIVALAFAIKMASFLFSPISGYGFGGDLCEALYPWFFYPIPEALPAVAVLTLMSPDPIWHNHLAKIVRCLPSRVNAGRRESISLEDDQSEYLAL